MRSHIWLTVTCGMALAGGAVSPPAQAEQPAKAERVAHEFTGGYFSDSLQSGSDGTRICVFFDPARAGRDPSGDDIGKKVLEALVADATDLARLPNIVDTMMMGDVVEGHPVSQMLRYVVLPSRSFVVAGGAVRAPGPRRFDSGSVSSMRELRKRFGHATERQRWSGVTSERLGVSGAIEWWGSTGVHTGDDGSITHVLLRQMARTAS